MEREACQCSQRRVGTERHLPFCSALPCDPLLPAAKKQREREEQERFRRLQSIDGCHRNSQELSQKQHLTASTQPDDDMSFLTDGMSVELLFILGKDTHATDICLSVCLSFDTHRVCAYEGNLSRNFYDESYVEVVGFESSFK